MNGQPSASAAARDDQRASSIINSPCLDCRNFPSFEAEIAGEFECLENRRDVGSFLTGGLVT